MISNAKQLCRHHIMNKCKFGSSCKYSHQTIKCYLMRHAESQYNQTLKANLNDAYSPQAKKQFQLDESLIDCGLTEQGLLSIQNKETINQIFPNHKFSFDIIFVSPLERCLMTANKLIIKHKINSKEIIVHPGLTQVLSKICDMSTSISGKIKKYEKFNFKYMTEKYEDHKTWQDDLVDEDLRSMINEEEECGKRYLQILNQIFPRPLENSKRCFDRVLDTISSIREICEEKEAKTILIVSHNRIIKYIMGRYNFGRFESIMNTEVRITRI